MKKIFTQILKIWFSLPQPLRFFLVGGFNTVFSFTVFSLLVIFKINYTLSIIIAYILGTNCSIFTMRYFVYQNHRNILQSYVKGWMAYLSLFAVNYIFLYIFIELFHYTPIITQACYTILSPIYIYLVHKYFTFKNSKLCR
ncbi:MAG: GtrA family protein [Alphaproteobacteria bacterium]|nr:GtrA family protein [Alphaproteobacteria bacterium]